MKVMCIEDDWGCNDWARPKFGDVDNVKGTHRVGGFNFYELGRFNGYAFWENCFIPLSDMDETELVNNKNEQYA